jgi:hypothetical protein
VYYVGFDFNSTCFLAKDSGYIFLPSMKSQEIDFNTYGFTKRIATIRLVNFCFTESTLSIARRLHKKELLLIITLLTRYMSDIEFIKLHIITNRWWMIVQRYFLSTHLSNFQYYNDSISLSFSPVAERRQQWGSRCHAEILLLKFTEDHTI